MNSKIILILFPFLCVCCCANAQGGECLHSFQLGDHVARQQVTYKINDGTGAGLHWDLSDLDVINESSSVEYMEDENVPFGIVSLDNSTRYHYLQSDGHTFLHGYENNLSEVRYNKPELYLSSNMNLGYEEKGMLNGYAVYSEKVYSRIYGSYHYQVDAKGTLLLPSGDSLENVTRIHLSKTIGQKYLRHLNSLDSLRLLVDSISPYTEDSIKSHLSEDSCLVETNDYRWYAQGYRYPIYETIESHVKGSKLGFMTAYYIPPYSQEQLIGEEKSSVKSRKNESSRVRNSDFTTANKLVGISERKVLSDGSIFDYSLNVSSAGIAHIVVSGSKNLKVTCSINSIDGIMLRAHNFETTNSQSLSWDCPLGKSSHRVCVLSLSVNGQTFSDKFVW